MTQLFIVVVVALLLRLCRRGCLCFPACLLLRLALGTLAVLAILALVRALAAGALLGRLRSVRFSLRASPFQLYLAFQASCCAFRAGERGAAGCRRGGISPLIFDEVVPPHRQTFTVILS